MAWLQQRLDRLRQIVAELIKRNITPRDTTFANVVQGIAASFGVSKKTASDYLDTLLKSWKYTKWIPFVRHNDYMSKEEREAWIKKWKRE